MSKYPEVGGTIGMFRDAILSISKSEQKDMALGAALALGGVLTANRFTMNGEAVFTPMYVMNVGETSSGKDAGIRLFTSLFSPGGLGSNKYYRLLGLSNYSSDVSMISTLPENRTRIDYFEEFGEVFKGLAMKGDRKSSVGDCMKKMFSAKNYFKGHFTVTNGWKGECAYPSVSVFATIQPRTLLTHATPEILFDGLLGRFMYFSQNKDAKYLGNQRRGGLSHQVLRSIADECFRIYPENPIVDIDVLGNPVVETHLCDFHRQQLTLPIALDNHIEEVDRAHHDTMKKLSSEGKIGEAAAYGKAIENAEKIMKILCVGYGERTITLKHFEEAMQIVMVSHETNKELVIGAGSRAVERNAEKLLKFVQKSPNGQVKRTAAMQFTHLEPKEMRDAIELLEQRDELIQISNDQEAKKSGNGRLPVYLCLVMK